jgi:hypothetical protein
LLFPNLESEVVRDTTARAWDTCFRDILLIVFFRHVYKSNRSTPFLIFFTLMKQFSQRETVPFRGLVGETFSFKMTIIPFLKYLKCLLNGKLEHSKDSNNF